MKKIFEATYIYALLIFLGFFNYYSFYKCFDIEISSYLTSSELLLSFLPFTIPILIIIAMGTIFSIFVIAKISFEKDTQKETNSEESDFLSLYLLRESYDNIKKSFKKRKWKSFKEVFYIFSNIITSLIGLFLIAFFIGYIFHFLCKITSQHTLIHSTSGEVFMSGFFWFILLNGLITKTFKTNSLINYFRIFVIALFSIGCILISNKESSYKILSGESSSSIEFEYKDKIIKTTENIVFVGKTEKYIFLRDLSEKKNLIYPIEQVGLMVTSKNNNIKKK